MSKILVHNLNFGRSKLCHLGQGAFLDSVVQYSTEKTVQCSTVQYINALHSVCFFKENTSL